MLDPAKVEAIVSACREIREGALREQFVVDVLQKGAGTSTNMNANEVIANRALELRSAPDLVEATQDCSWGKGARTGFRAPRRPEREP